MIAAPAHPERLTRREREIMHAIFALGNRASAEAIRARMPHPPGDSAVRITLGRLEEKGHVRHEKQGPRFVYSATTAPGVAKRRALRQPPALLPLREHELDAAARFAGWWRREHETTPPPVVRVDPRSLVVWQLFLCMDQVALYRRTPADAAWVAREQLQPPRALLAAPISRNGGSISLRVPHPECRLAPEPRSGVLRLQEVATYLCGSWLGADQIILWCGYHRACAAIACAGAEGPPPTVLLVVTNGPGEVPSPPPGAGATTIPGVDGAASSTPPRLGDFFDPSLSLRVRCPRVHYEMQITTAVTAGAVAPGGW